MAAPPSASSSRPPPAPSLVPPPRLVNDLAALRDPARVSDELWQDATEESVLWLLSLAPSPTSTASSTSAPPSAKGKERARTDDDGVALDEQLVHWYCGARGAGACWEPATLCVRLLGMKRLNQVADWRDQFERCVLLSRLLSLLEVSSRLREAPAGRGEPEPTCSTFAS